MKIKWIRIGSSDDAGGAWKETTMKDCKRTEMSSAVAKPRGNYYKIISEWNNMQNNVERCLKCSLVDHRLLADQFYCWLKVKVNEQQSWIMFFGISSSTGVISFILCAKAATWWISDRVELEYQKIVHHFSLSLFRLRKKISQHWYWKQFSLALLRKNIVKHLSWDSQWCVDNVLWIWDDEITSNFNISCVHIAKAVNVLRARE